MAVKIPPKTIISLFITIMIVIVVYAIIAPIFTGPETAAWKTLGDEINNVCGSSQNAVSQVSIYLPDSKGSTGLNLVFFYLAIDHDTLALARRTFGVEKNDVLINFVDYVRNKPGNSLVRTVGKNPRVLSNCLKNNIRICGMLDPAKLDVVKCDSFQFESEEGKESLTFTINKTTYQGKPTVLLSYTKATYCGDNRCCEGETETNCPIDCKTAKPCKPLTQG